MKHSCLDNVKQLVMLSVLENSQHYVKFTSLLCNVIILKNSLGAFVSYSEPENTWKKGPV